MTIKIKNLTKDSLIIEIGPGLGSLTEHLLSKAKHVLAYEIDGELIPILQNTFNKEDTIIKCESNKKSPVLIESKNRTAIIMPMEVK